jgi:hypothetical protein
MMVERLTFVALNVERLTFTVSRWNLSNSLLTWSG